MFTSDKFQNRLLAALEPADYALLSPLLRTGYFAQGLPDVMMPRA
jgi:hypothetical protein